jgi:hypothetical protein
MRFHYSLFGGAALALAACSSDSGPGSTIGGGGTAGSNGTSGSGGSNNNNGGSSGFIEFGGAGPGCEPTTCAELGWACGYTVDACGNVTNCADEGLTCADNQVCVGGIDGPTECVAGGGATCEVCQAVPECDGEPQPTRLAGRVITPGRNDGNIENQVGVPNAVVYILRTNSESDLPAITAGLPSGAQSCDRCEDQDLGPLLTGAITDAAGNFVLEGNVPVGVEFLLVVKAGKFRRAVRHTVLAEQACQTTTLPSTLAEGNPTRLPRNMSDGLAVNIPRIAISTGRIDAMECVFEKMGIEAATEFGNHGSDARVHLYRGGLDGEPEGARIDGSTPVDAQLYGSLERLESYDMVVADCEGGAWDLENEPAFSERDASGGNVREYVNRGGRLFASHLSMSWLHQNGTTAYDAAAPNATGLGPAATWVTDYLNDANLSTSGTGVVSLIGDREHASPRIQGFADWLVRESVTTAPDYEFAMTDPRSLADDLGGATEEFVHREDGNGRAQQFSFNTPYAAPEAAACGRVAYSGFHVASTAGGSDPFINATFPGHCTNALANNGNLTNQEKVLLYMLFDLGSCVGDPPLPPPCVPVTCTSVGARCGSAPDGCGGVIDCGACRPPA